MISEIFQGADINEVSKFYVSNMLRCTPEQHSKGLFFFQAYSSILNLMHKAEHNTHQCLQKQLMSRRIIL